MFLGQSGPPTAAGVLAEDRRDIREIARAAVFLKEIQQCCKTLTGGLIHDPECDQFNTNCDFFVFTKSMLGVEWYAYFTKIQN